MSTLHDFAPSIEAVRTVKDPVIPPADDDAYEPTAADLSWLLAQRPAAAATPWDAHWLAAWELARHVDQALHFDAWLDAIAAQHEVLAISTAGARYLWLARQVHGLARTARYLGATGPDDYDDRADVLGMREHRS